MIGLMISFFSFFMAYGSLPDSSEIYGIDFGQNDQDDVILLKNGNVFHSHSNQRRKVLKLLPKISRTKIELNDLPQFDETFEPTIIDAPETLLSYFNQGRYKKKESQCYNRAHVWNFEWFKNHGILSQKAWLFFSLKYIRKYKFDWWFHVAPVMKLKKDDGFILMIMDIKYLDSPRDLTTWTSVFMRNKADCPVISSYVDYANYPESQWCSVLLSSMFYYQPIDLEIKDHFGTIKSNWDFYELKISFQDALDEIF